MTQSTKGATRREFIAAGAGAAAFAAIGFNRLALAEDAGDFVTQLVTFKIQEGKDEQAVELLTALTRAVEENEPGVLAYAAHRSTKDPSEVVFFEIYQNQEAVAAHRTAPHMGEMFPKFATVFEPGLDITPLERIGGYTRPS